MNLECVVFERFPFSVYGLLSYRVEVSGKTPSGNSSLTFSTLSYVAGSRDTSVSIVT